MLYVPTMDNHVVALDARTGKEIWVHLVQKTDGMLRMSSGPIVTRGKVIVATTGCIVGVPTPRGCAIFGLDAKTGEQAWRFNTVPVGNELGADSWGGAPDAERIGGGVWTSGTYDPSTGLAITA